MAGPKVHDRHWIRQSFLLPSGMIDDLDKKRRINSSGNAKFSDTTLGGNQAINPIPQACKFADIREERLFDMGMGQGRVHSEVFDDNSVLVNLRAGVPAHSAMLDFFGNFYSGDASVLARTGRGRGLMYTMGLIGGAIITLPYKPIFMLGDMLHFMLGKSKTKFYYLKPTMEVYWDALNGMVNAYAVERGILDGSPEFTGVGDGTDGNVSAYIKRDADADSQLDKLLPDIYPRVEGADGGKGGIDIYALSTRYQRMANAQYEKVRNWRASYQGSFGTPEMAEDFNNSVLGLMIDTRRTSLREAMEKWANSPFGSEVAETSTGAPGEKSSYDTVVENISMLFGDNTSSPEARGALAYMAGILRDGAQWITYRVDPPGDMSESFSSSVKESSLASGINSMSSGARDFRFNISGGNVSDNALVSAFEGMVGGVTDVISGLASSVGIDGLSALAGNANIDIMKYWDSSSANLPKHNYTFELKAPYQNEICRFQTLMVPLFGLLAMALPRATGGSSYTSPFYVEAYCQGYAQVREGIIDSISITRGEFTRDGRPLSIQVSFSIIDMSTIMSMPLSANFTPLDVFNSPMKKWVTNDDNAFSDYMAVLASSSLVNQVYPWRKLKRNVQRTIMNMDDWFSPTRAASWIGGMTLSRFASSFWNATDRK